MHDLIRWWSAAFDRIAPRTAILTAILIVPIQAFVFGEIVLGQQNIVLIMSDDAGYNDFGFMSALNGISTDIQTPNLDALAARSMVMSSSYAAAPICSPSRAGLLTGQYQQRFGYEENPGDNDGLDASQQLVSHYLRDLGYTTGAIGKWHLGQTDGVNLPLDMGFDEFFGFFGGSRPYYYWSGADYARQMRRGDVNIESQWNNPPGRYATDAFADEAVDFINRHADDENPFFLYVAMNAPHTPLNAKQSDLDLFAGITDTNRRYIAAMTYALDRAVGNITGALTANGLDENTLIVFMNDNGGPAPNIGPYNNAPLRGNKGSLWEGGMRVPMLISAPGLSPGVYDQPVVGHDLAPTFINAAGGDSSEYDFSGVDLMPFLTGEVAEDPHELIFWRSADGRFAVRKGDWKLVRPGLDTFARLHDVAADIHEDTLLNSQQPALVAELLRELTFWEAGLRKMKWGALGSPRNRFDHFVFRNDLAPTGNWSTASGWQQAGTTNNVTFRNEDSYANAILEFGVRNDADYTSTNNMLRMTAQTFMLNQMRLTGSFSGAADHSGTINGNALLFVKDLDGQLPQVRLDATASAPGPQFTFQLGNELQLLDDLEITGDGTQQFVISGNIRDYYQPRNVIKSGASSVTLGGSNTFAGALILNDGRVRATTLAGDLENNGGTFAPGATQAPTTIGGSFVQNSGLLEIELGGTTAGTQFDTLVIDGAAQLGGGLDVQLINGFMPQIGDTFQFLTAGVGVTGSFAQLALPSLVDGMWTTRYTATSVSLSVAMPGDFNGDGAVNTADYVTWRKAGGGTPAEYDMWRSNFGRTTGLGAAAVYTRDGSPTAPEPSALLLIIVGLATIVPLCRNRKPRSALVDRIR